MEPNYFTILSWFLPYIDMNQPWVYMCPPFWTPFPPPSPSHPSELSQCTSPEHPVSCIDLGLVIYLTYGNIYVSMLFSQIIPLSPFPPQSPKVCSLHLCLKTDLSVQFSHSETSETHNNCWPHLPLLKSNWECVANSFIAAQITLWVVLCISWFYPLSWNLCFP